MNPKTYINLVCGVLCLLLIGAGAYGVYSYKSMAQKVAELEPLQAQVVELQEQQAALSAEVIRRADLDAAIRTSRQSVSHNLDKVTNEDPVARDYLGERIPDSVRAAFLADEAER